MRPTDEVLDAAAKRLAISLMRLNEALERADADQYPLELTSYGVTRRYHRHQKLDQHYNEWYRNHE